MNYGLFRTIFDKPSIIPSAKKVWSAATRWGDNLTCWNVVTSHVWIRLFKERIPISYKGKMLIKGIWRSCGKENLSQFQTIDTNYEFCTKVLRQKPMPQYLREIVKWVNKPQLPFPLFCIHLQLKASWQGWLKYEGGIQSEFFPQKTGPVQILYKPRSF